MSARHNAGYEDYRTDPRKFAEWMTQAGPGLAEESVARRFLDAVYPGAPGRPTESARREEEAEEEEGAGKGAERVGRERRRGALPASPLASLSLDTPFSGSPTPGGGPWFPFSPHRDTDKVTHPEKGQSVGRSVARSSRNSCPV